VLLAVLESFTGEAPPVRARETGEKSAGGPGVGAATVHKIFSQYGLDGVF